MFPPEQMYVLLIAENAGIDLEGYKVIHPFQVCCSPPTYNFSYSIQFSSVEEVQSVISQVAGALAVGEAVSVLHVV